ncbi:hypothetical protein G7L40_20400 [Paenibacillus polymyxa]|uniref:Uncharacterized protein n=1 Tax=Paenibacillus polymyxa TaxID=1406 RepID=A0A378XZH3_PAEPO|nr:hypothetical protein [Paenibacillus polymyxa]MBE7896149.1 hypothetical protein [Paenibacillus polymyxa]MBG9765907.1 transposase [Paenibacillus polymyxa]MCC3256679.1 hypothetical protein [Paenibacillus polymyxa]QPK54830.1 hypothetical protein G7035_20445 [Paenibacillus polymyxa]QPK59921.1 hypothetical protein G7L40_20400 [Paenibacillus polymyxa]
MPYIKKDDFRQLCCYFFRQGCNAGYGIDVSENLWEQEEEAFRSIYEDYLLNIFSKKEEIDV